jgi:hypothetical protein
MEGKFCNGIKNPIGIMRINRHEINRMREFLKWN